ncbi:TIGR04282 family arsenosugar biosynthesis glycosyltransferase [Candidatus Margulisiibacteriota bacterium]
MEKTKQALIIFMKYPESGKVKTRLAKDIGAQKACEIYKKLISKTFEISRGVKADKLVFINNENKISECKKIFRENFSWYSQIGNDLGQKMANAFKQVFELGYSKVIIIGSDCLHLTADIIENAFQIVKKQKIVIGPASDGGYYLIGFNSNNFEKSYFEGIDWSTNKVYNQTIKKIKVFTKLDTLNDLDTFEDLKKEGVFL